VSFFVPDLAQERNDGYEVSLPLRRPLLARSILQPTAP
jgi:hypothetical protein